MEIFLKNKKFKVKTVISKKDTQKGMMKKKFDSTFNGMLFLMDDGEHCFWMKNCIIPLDIIFINDNVITNIHHNCEICTTDECPNYCGEGNLILEVPAGTCKKIGLKRGDKVKF
jgi:hypothetical protein